MNSINRYRGVAAVRADHSPNAQIGEVLAELNSTFTDWRARNDSRVRDLETFVNRQAETIEGLRMGGGPGLDPGAGFRLSGFGVAPITSEVREEFLNAMRGMPNAGMTSQSGPDGGFTVRPEVDNTIDALMRNGSVLRNLARVVVITSGDSWQKILGRSGSQSGWAGEEDTRADTGSPALGMVTITPWELYAMPELTNQLIEDSSFDVQSFLTEDVIGEFALKEGAAFISGDGAKKPLGFLSRATATTADATRAFGTLQYVPSGAASAFASTNPADALHDLLSALRPAYRVGDGVAWIMNSTTANVIRKFKDGQGNYLWSASIVTGQPDRLLGYPVAIDESMPDIAANKFPVAFGNWRRGFAIVDKPGLRLIADRVTKKGWTKMYFSRRTGGGVVDSNAIKLLKIATS